MRRPFSWAIISFFLFGLVVPNTSLAVDSRCFTREDCQRLRGDVILDSPETADGFYTGSDAQMACGVADNNGKNAAGVEYGFCLPVSNSVTKISFGGRQSFANFGEFIQYIYKYGMWLAGIVAVGLIIISGFQWAASGGNSDMIGSAKNRISGAVTGLILLVLAYTILNTINPYLVQLRLPQTWMINEIGVSPPFCSQVGGKKLATLGPADPPPNETQVQLALTQAKNSGYNIEPSTAACGSEYLVDGNGTQSCSGTVCDPENGSYRLCAPESITENATTGLVTKNKRECHYGNIMFHVSIASDIFSQAFTGLTDTIPGSGFLVNKFNTDGHWIDSDVWAQAVCDVNGKPTFGYEYELEGTQLPPPAGKAWSRITYLKKGPNKLNTEEYIIRVGNLAIQDETQCELEDGSKKYPLLGWRIRIELDAASDTDDVKLVAGYKDGRMTFGAPHVRGDWIPLSVIKEGIFGYAPINLNLMKELFDDDNH